MAGGAAPRCRRAHLGAALRRAFPVLRSLHSSGRRCASVFSARTRRSSRGDYPAERSDVERGQKFREAVKVFKEEINAHPVIERRRNGEWLPRSDFDKWLDITWVLREARKLTSMKTHAGREKKLARLKERFKDFS